MNKSRKNIVVYIGLIVLLFLVFLFISFQIAFAGKILPGVRIGMVEVGGMTKVAAIQKLSAEIDNLFAGGMSVNIGESKEMIWLENIDFSFEKEETINRAFAIGRSGSLIRRFKEWLSLFNNGVINEAVVNFDQQVLADEFELIGLLYNTPLKDVRLEIENNEVFILEDTEPGKTINKSEAQQIFLDHMRNINSAPIKISFQDDMPQVNITSADNAKEQAERIIAEPIILTYKNREFVISKEQIGEWVMSGSEGKLLKVLLDEQSISSYIATLADDINVVPQNISIDVKEGKVVKFVPPKKGEVLEQDKSIKSIIDALNERLDGKFLTSKISLPIIIKKPIADETAASLGIIEKIGSATTPFTGSPPNRVHNIKNGVKFLSGILIAPGEEFSTVGALGTIDNTTGYLPELVIKGDRTIPEFGGGLCQVSTTLFRAVLNSGLPVTGRRNHSYRVPYYEYDGDGNYIGPGLDATIYNPNPDFKFKNDTGNYILIQGFVEGDKITFNLYGTKDGRVAEIDGPYILSEIPAGDPIYTDTDELPVGEIKRIESAHPGGSAIATYTVTYPNGDIKTEEFKSYYRNWPARYLVGTKEE